MQPTAQLVQLEFGTPDGWCMFCQLFFFLLVSQALNKNKILGTPAAQHADSRALYGILLQDAVRVICAL
jgi:hypothetical protein